MSYRSRVAEYCLTMNTKQNQMSNEYEAPKLEIYEFAPEQGFATSPGGDGGSLDEDVW